MRKLSICLQGTDARTCKDQERARGRGGGKEGLAPVTSCDSSLDVFDLCSSRSMRHFRQSKIGERKGPGAQH